MQTDTIADFLTRIRNANVVYKQTVVASSSKVKEAIAAVLTEEGYIEGYKIKAEAEKKFIELYLKYSANREKVITYLGRVSKPGRRVYVGKDEIPRVRSGLGICILSTSRGIFSGKKAKELGVGGELLCYIW